MLGGTPWDQQTTPGTGSARTSTSVWRGPPAAPPFQSCNNTEGGFSCVCNSGYRPRSPPKNGSPENGTGSPKNGSGTPENGNGTPENGAGSPKNAPGPPENGNGDPENGTGSPKNGAGTRKNWTRIPGKMTHPPIDCEDVDECAEGGEGRCGGGSVCLNTPGSFECHCPPPGRGTPGPVGCPGERPLPELIPKPPP
ncbi:adhesion G protein-coupled receptor E5-like [Chamaea fasciata]|uniref:adhesion G protein-coupled receptor E5-like n=1 Tax=Chamaea fasciata TaxID=190680 RepID=UPI00336AB368